MSLCLTDQNQQTNLGNLARALRVGTTLTKEALGATDLRFCLSVLCRCAKVSHHDHGQILPRAFRSVPSRHLNRLRILQLTTTAMWRQKDLYRVIDALSWALAHIHVL